VPLVSPWNKGGYVNSQVFDYTSVIQFIEKRFGVLKPNISWCRAVTGDLTSIFNFANPIDHDASLPRTKGFCRRSANLRAETSTPSSPL
jgi:phospholipase C